MALLGVGTNGASAVPMALPHAEDDAGINTRAPPLHPPCHWPPPPRPRPTPPRPRPTPPRPRRRRRAPRTIASGSYQIVTYRQRFQPIVDYRQRFVPNRHYRQRFLPIVDYRKRFVPSRHYRQRFLPIVDYRQRFVPSPRIRALLPQRPRRATQIDLRSR